MELEISKGEWGGANAFACLSLCFDITVVGDRLCNNPPIGLYVDKPLREAQAKESPQNHLFLSVYALNSVF